MATTTGVPKVSAPPRTADVNGVTFGASLLESQDVWDILNSHAGGSREVKVTYTIDPGPPPMIAGISKVESV